MVILSFGNEKGGVTKTTAAYLFSAYCSRFTKYKLLYVDADRQKSAATLRNLDHASGIEPLSGNLFHIVEETPEKIFDQISFAEKNGFDIVVLDLPASTQADGVMAAYSLCDFIFVPTSASETDTDSSQNFIEQVTDVITPIRAEHDKETSIYLLFSKVNRRGKKYKELYNSIRQSFPLVRNSIPYRESDFQNRSLFDTITKSKNRHEYHNFAKEILKIVGYENHK